MLIIHTYTQTNKDAHTKTFLRHCTNHATSKYSMLYIWFHSAMHTLHSVCACVFVRACMHACV